MLKEGVVIVLFPDHTNFLICVGEQIESGLNSVSHETDDIYLKRGCCLNLK